MSLCFEYKIPHGVFLSWPAEDRAKSLAYLIERNERCTMCGTAPWEWENNKFAYEPEDHFCRGCYLKHVANEDRQKLPGTTVELVRMTPSKLAAKQIMEAKRREITKKARADEEKIGPPAST